MSQVAEDNWDVVVVGAGAAGLVAAIRAAELGRRTLLLEKNRRPGVKILMSGGTRCNITQATDNRGIIEAFGRPGRFLHSALAALSVQDSVALFEAEGVKTKVEATGKVFPVSNRATDVLDALLARLARSGAVLATEEPLLDLQPLPEGLQLVTSKRTLNARNMILTTGGQSYPGSGTTGDGYPWAASLGHTIVPPRPSLVPVTVEAPWVRALKGITIPDVALRVLEVGPSSGYASTAELPIKPKSIASRRGSLLFTHFGLSGPVVLDVSRYISGHERPRELALECDFLPPLNRTALDELLTGLTAKSGKSQLAAILPEVLPWRLVESLLTVVGVPPGKKAAEVSKRDLARVGNVLKQLLLPVTGTMGFRKAEVTAGGVALDEVDSRNLRSKLVRNLYLAGEILDLDGPIGGYNFQAAWSTGWLAGHSAANDST